MCDFHVYSALHVTFHNSTYYFVHSTISLERDYILKSSIVFILVFSNAFLSVHIVHKFLFPV